MNFNKLKEWGNKEFKCKCGFIGSNKNKKKHEDSELCKCLMKYNYGSIKGTDYVECHKCHENKMVCGLQIHMKTHNK
jgi:hypothetical protein